MCGLVGVLLCPQQRTPEVWREILRITTSNLVANEKRGRDAAGVAIVQQNGEFALFKQPVLASDLIKMPEYDQVLNLVGNRTTCILGHTRMPTKGSRWKDVNNHPLHAGHILGIHNGTVWNDDLLFEQCQYERTGEVDSEIIFRLHNSVDPDLNNKRYSESIAERVSMLEGTFSTLSIDLRKAERLLVLKKLQPLCLHYEPAWQALFFSSRYVFLRQAFGRSVVTEALDNGTGFLFDAATLPELGNRPVSTFEIADRHNQLSEAERAEVQPGQGG